MIRDFFVEKLLGSVTSVVRSASSAFLYFLSPNDLKKEVTEKYPDPVSSVTEDDLPARSRGLLFNDIETCTGCGDCVSACPVSCIRLQVEPGPKDSKKWVSVFDIDFSSCIFCGQCVRVCRPGSLVHTKKFEASAYTANDLVVSYGRGVVSPELRLKWSRLNEGKEEAL